MIKKRKISELIGRVIEMKDDKRRYLVMPLEIRSFDGVLGTIEGRISSDDIISKNSVVIMPLDEIPEKRRQLNASTEEGETFVVRNIRPEDREIVKILNNSMSLVLENTKKVYRNLTEIEELEERYAELGERIKKLKDANSQPFSRWNRTVDKTYLVELYKNEVDILNAKKRLDDPNRPLYKTSLTGGGNASKIEVLELLKVTDKRLYYRFGLAYRGAEAKPVTREEAIDAWLNGRNGGFIDMDEYNDRIEINEYSANDMW